MKFLMMLFLFVTGGRPMSYGRTLYDNENGMRKNINMFYDYRGRQWIAHNKWSFMRVRYDKAGWSYLSPFSTEQIEDPFK